MTLGRSVFRSNELSRLFNRGEEKRTSWRVTRVKLHILRQNLAAIGVTTRTHTHTSGSRKWFAIFEASRSRVRYAVGRTSGDYIFRGNSFFWMGSWRLRNEILMARLALEVNRTVLIIIYNRLGINRIRWFLWPFKFCAKRVGSLVICMINWVNIGGGETV